MITAGCATPLPPSTIISGVAARSAVIRPACGKRGTDSVVAASAGAGAGAGGAQEAAEAQRHRLAARQRGAAATLSPRPEAAPPPQQRRLRALRSSDATRRLSSHVRVRAARFQLFAAKRPRRLVLHGAAAQTV